MILKKLILENLKSPEWADNFIDDLEQYFNTSFEITSLKAADYMKFTDVIEISNNNIDIKLYPENSENIIDLYQIIDADFPLKIRVIPKNTTQNLLNKYEKVNEDNNIVEYDSIIRKILFHKHSKNVGIYVTL